MILEDLEKDLENIVKAIEQTLANHNVLLGQKTAIASVIARMKEAADVAETVAPVLEGEVIPAAQPAETPAT